MRDRDTEGQRAERKRNYFEKIAREMQRKRGREGEGERRGRVKGKRD